MTNYTSKPYIYFWQIGCYIFKVYTSRNNLELPFFAISKKRIDNLNNLIPITISLEEDILIKNRMINFCKSNGKSYVPKELEFFYNIINKQLRKKFFFF